MQQVMVGPYEGILGRSPGRGPASSVDGLNKALSARTASQIDHEGDRSRCPVHGPAGQ